jgi:P27 family predicted phage terminase small subunit
MGKRGPKPKPNFLRMLEGNPSHRPLADEIPAPKTDCLPVPEWLDEGAAAIWQEVCSELAAMGGLSFCDRQTLALYVNTLADCQRLARKLLELGDTVIPTQSVQPEFDPETGAFVKMVTKITGCKPHPYFAQLQTQKRLALTYAQQFGSTPAARNRVTFLSNGCEVKENDDPFAVG